MRLLDSLNSANREFKWTYAGLAKLVDLEVHNKTLHQAIEILSSRPTAKLLDMHFLYFDPLQDDPAGEEIPDDAVIDAFQEGFLVDPSSGAEVHDFMKHLAPYFCVSPEVK